ncbi:dimethyl sulfone monooxygenase SfnG [Pseudomonas edaphica]|uniref:Dimethyl sulfone monooxygenase SfnG n=1 Tax=Pseudomonas edaphica TaxID=2006980 RepID=A0ABY2U442_9PSED|nr:dimethyl sulfone monooxygenase SfnG [Pseudomonas edaphica]TLG91077.1 dimethyl sulfone monooxygenase SfnG [Pseudomonas edaphica]
MPIEFGYWAPNLGTSLVATRINNHTRGTFAANREYAQIAEHNGFKYTLLATRFVSSLEGNEGTYDSMVMAAAIAAVTTQLVPIVAVATGLAHPAIVAKQLVTLDEISQGRAAVNVVSGWLKDEYTALGEPWLEHGERYRRTEEFIEVLRATWADGQAEYAGDFFRLRNADFRPKPRPGAIPVFQGGNSVAAREMAARQSDFYFMNGAPLDSLREHIAHVKALAAQQNRTVRFAVNAFVISRPTEAQAREVLEAIIENADIEVVERFRKNVQHAGQATIEKQGMWAESRFEDLIQFNDGFKTGLIGTPEQIAERITALTEIGVDMLLAGFLHYDDELLEFGREVIPLVWQLAQARSLQGPET